MTWRPATKDVLAPGAAVAQIVLPSTLPPAVPARLETTVPDVAQPTGGTFVVS